jgi:hypothetical protein
MDKKPTFDGEQFEDIDCFKENPALKRFFKSIVYDTKHPVKKRIRTIGQNITNFYENRKEEIKTIGGYSLFVGLCLFGMRGCNMLWNNTETVNSSRHTISHATGLIGHNEYTQYKDGSVDLKVYPGNPRGHRLLVSKLYQDLDGDRKVDRIRINGSEFTVHHLIDIFSRKEDYIAHSGEFDLGDRLLTEESKKLK